MELTDNQRRTCAAIVQIFETSRLSAEAFSAVANAKGDRGGLSYGRHQASIASGNLYKLLALYCSTPNARDAEKIKIFLPTIRVRQQGIDDNLDLQRILRLAGTDPVMQQCQEDFFGAQFWDPAARKAEALGFGEPLSMAVLYDSFIQSGSLKPFPIGVPAANEKNWIEQYCRRRKDWLAGLDSLAKNSTYRPDSFLKLIAAGKWDLSLPLTVRGVVITEVNLL